MRYSEAELREKFIPVDTLKRRIQLYTLRNWGGKGKEKEE